MILPPDAASDPTYDALAAESFMKAMILAAGRGERMRPLSDAKPKPLIEVRGKALIVWLIEALARAGIRDIVINHAHLGQMIETALGDGGDFGVRIAYSAEPQALETAGGIAKALPLLGAAPFLAVNGDIFCDFDFAPLAARSLGADLAHLVLVPNPPHHAQGDFGLEGDRAGTEGDPRWTFSGIGLYRPEFFDSVPRESKAQLVTLLRSAMARGQVGAQVHTGAWHDVGTPERLAAINARLA